MHFAHIECERHQQAGPSEAKQKASGKAPRAALWYKTVKRAEWKSLGDVRRDYPSADQVGNVLIFNVLGGNYRLIVRITYSGQRIYVKALMTHREYDRKEWMKWA